MGRQAELVIREIAAHEVFVRRAAQNRTAGVAHIVATPADFNGIVFPGFVQGKAGWSVIRHVVGYFRVHPYVRRQIHSFVPWEIRYPYGGGKVVVACRQGDAVLGKLRMHVVNHERHGLIGKTFLRHHPRIDRIEQHFVLGRRQRQDRGRNSKVLVVYRHRAARHVPVLYAKLAQTGYRIVKRRAFHRKRMRNLNFVPRLVRSLGHLREKIYLVSSHIRDRGCAPIHIVPPEIGIVGPGNHIDGAVAVAHYIGHGPRLSLRVRKVQAGRADIHIVQVNRGALVTSPLPVPLNAQGPDTVPFEFCPQIGPLGGIRPQQIEPDRECSIVYPGTGV